jgi:hypothetical protein
MSFSNDMNEPGRKRIVINLDQSRGAQPAKKRTSRWPKVLALLIGVIIFFVLIAAAGGYLWWRHYETTPAYSLALLLDAAQRNDMAAFDQQLDNDEIARNMVTSFRQRAASRYGAALSGSLPQQIDSKLPVILPGLKQTVHDELARQLKEFSAKSASKPFFIVALTVPWLVKIVAEAETAQVTATFQDRPVLLAMRRNGDRWKVTALNDDSLTERVVDDMIKELPAIGQLDQLLKPEKRKARRRQE